MARDLGWARGSDGDWIDLADRHASEAAGCHGVYVIWRSHPDTARTEVLYVGQGFVAEEIAARRLSPIFRGARGLRVTWGAIDSQSADAVAAYLCARLKPIWGETPSSPDSQETVNLPFQV